MENSVRRKNKRQKGGIFIRTTRNHKDRLFIRIFKEKKDLLQLYNAVNDSHYTNPDDLEIVTLEDALYLSMKNDLSFIISSELNLYEHQSTICPNMPLRGLFYLATQYKGLIADNPNALYSSRLIKLPVPRYIVFYNGETKQPERQVLNINYGHNKSLQNIKVFKTLVKLSATMLYLWKRYALTAKSLRLLPKPSTQPLTNASRKEF